MNPLVPNSQYRLVLLGEGATLALGTRVFVPVNGAFLH
jgi:hypothetical protein